jgi:hypothetical protein
MGADCKSAGYAYAGSNPARPTTINLDITNLDTTGKNTQGSSLKDHLSTKLIANIIAKRAKITLIK